MGIYSYIQLYIYCISYIYGIAVMSISSNVLYINPELRAADLEVQMFINTAK